MTDPLLAWFDDHRRELPWRRPQDRADPYRVLVAEVMLQQTRVDTVVPYYGRWLDRFPSFRALAAAREQAVLLAWEGLGYYRRARNLRASARVIVDAYGGALPTDVHTLRRLPGIGRYTAAALMAAVHGQPLIAVDGNVRRIASRLLGSLEAVSDARAERTLIPLAHGPRGAEVAEALIELGALVCTPRAPACGLCPLRPGCSAAASADPAAFPAPRRRAAVSLRRRWALIALSGQTVADALGGPAEVAACGVTSVASGVAGAAPKGGHEAGGGRLAELWLTRRPSDGLLGGMWGFPQIDAAPRTPANEPLRPGPAPLATVRHSYSHFRLELGVLLVPLSTLVRHAPDAVPIGLDGLEGLPMSTVDRLVLRQLREAGLVSDPIAEAGAGSAPS